MFHRRPDGQLSISSPNSQRHRTKGLLQYYTPLVIPHNYAVHRAHLGYIYLLSPNATCRLRPTHSTPHQPTYQCAAAPQARPDPTPTFIRPHTRPCPTPSLAHRVHVLSRAEIVRRDWTDVGRGEGCNATPYLKLPQLTRIIARRNRFQLDRQGHGPISKAREALELTLPQHVLLGCWVPSHMHSAA
jgi:hypothetical protein